MRAKMCRTFVEFSSVDKEDLTHTVPERYHCEECTPNKGGAILWRKII